MVKFVKDNITVIIISAVFFIVSFMTLHDYGISWDEPIHFTRGQAYLNYFLNGETEYKDFSGRHSIYQETSFAESHFNIKDPAEAAFYAATIWAFWNSLKKYEWRWLLAAAIFFALALGTKFNILFLPLIILPWLILRDRRILNPLRVISKLPRKFLIMLFAAPVIITVIFFLSWPYLW